MFEALRTRRKQVAFIQVCHEEAAAFAAGGYAKCDGQPVLAITGHTFHDLIGTHYQQDVDLDKPFMDVAAFNSGSWDRPTFTTSWTKR
jgi:pyruvate dehydrogenase (quinone)